MCSSSGHLVWVEGITNGVADKIEAQGGLNEDGHSEGKGSRGA